MTEARESGSTTRSKSCRRSHSRWSHSRTVNGTSYFGGAGGASRRLTTSRRAPTPHNISEKVDAELLALLLRREWQLSYVTPLYRFRHGQLKDYSRMLSAFIVAEKQQGFLAGEGEGLDGSFKVSLSVLTGMAETADDAETVFIQIHSKPAFAKRNEPLTVAWSGWLTCVNGDPDFLRGLPEGGDFVSLPLFLSAGAEVGLGSLVRAWFERTFDCSFGRLELNHDVLQWLAALWTNCHPEQDIGRLALSYALPAEPPLDVDYALRSQDVWELWRGAREQHRREGEDDDEGDIGTGEEEAIDIAEVKRFFKGLEGHFYRHFRLHLSAGNLSQVSTALGSAKCSGRIKIINKKYMISTLTLLTEMAVLKMPF